MNDFLYRWDDGWQVMNQYTEGGINLDNLRAIFSEFYHGQYSPVNECMYLFIYSLFGYNPLAFHLASLLLHIGNVCLAYIILIRIITQKNRMTIAYATAIAFITMLLFVVHPLNVETVAWISASKILVYVFFYLVATYTYLIYLDRKKKVFYILTILLFALSFGGKEQAVVFPVWLLMLHWLSGDSLKKREIWMQIAPFFVLVIVFGIVTVLSQATAGRGILSGATTYPFWQRIILACYSIFEYFAKYLFPYKLMYLYPFPIVVGEPLHEWMLLYPVLLVIILITLWRYISKAPVAAGLVFFLIHIALVLHIIPIFRFAIIADRYIYLSSIGLSFIVAYYLVRLISNRSGWVRKTVIGCFLGITLILSVYSNLRSREWKDTKHIKRDLKELLKQRDDYIPEELEEIMNEEKNKSEEENK